MNMNLCKAGDILISCHGAVLKYLGKTKDAHYPHNVKYTNGSRGTRLDNGQVYGINRMESDEDIVFSYRPYQLPKNRRGVKKTKEQFFGDALVSFLKLHKMDLTEKQIENFRFFFETGFSDGWHQGLPY